MVTFTEKGAKVNKAAVFATDIYLDSSLSDVDSNILKERKHPGRRRNHHDCLYGKQRKTNPGSDDAWNQWDSSMWKIRRFGAKLSKSRRNLQRTAARYKYIVVKTSGTRSCNNLSQYIYDRNRTQSLYCAIIMIV